MSGLTRIERRVRQQRHDLEALATLWRSARPGCAVCVECVASLLGIVVTRRSGIGKWASEARREADERGCGCRNRIDDLCVDCRDSIAGVGDQLARGMSIELVTALLYLALGGGSIRPPCSCAAPARPDWSSA
jgi:hypothetical protein